MSRCHPRLLLRQQTGAYWATRTILQGLKLNNFETFPKGITRDYPLYEIRGYIMDVARRPFTMDFMEQIVKEMSWYKMNDFQVHINDNLIGLENKEDPMSAYSAFRLESSIKRRRHADWTAMAIPSDAERRESRLPAGSDEHRPLLHEG